MHYYEFNIADYRKDTAHLLPIEHYIYRSLIDWYYLDERPICGKTQGVLRRLSLGSEFLENLVNVLNDFFICREFEGEKFFHHKKIDFAIAIYQRNSLISKENGKKGGRPKGSTKQQLNSSNNKSKKPRKTQGVNSANPEKPTLVKPLTNNHKPITNNQSLKDNIHSAENDEIYLLIDYLNDKTGKKFKTTESNCKLIRSRINQGHTSDEIRKVIDLKCAEWLTDKSMNKYLRPSTLFNDEKFNQYVGEINYTPPRGYKNETNQKPLTAAEAEQAMRESIQRRFGGDSAKTNSSGYGDGLDRSTGQERPLVVDAEFRRH